MSTTHTSVCPYDCPDACGLLVTEENGTVISVKGNPNHPFTRGTLCQKMAHYEQTVHSPLRLKKPLKRTGPKGSGQFEPISWDQAIKAIAKEFTHCIDTYGSESLYSYSYAGTMGLIGSPAANPLFALLGASQQDRGICSPAKKYGWQEVMGSTKAIKPQEMKDSDFVIFWGLNALCTNLHIMHDWQAAKKNGAKLWVIETHRSKTCDYADKVTLIRSGTDGALALGILYILIKENLIDKDFIQKYTIGYDMLKTAVIDTYTPEYVANITGIAADEIIELAHTYGQANAPFIRMGSGITRYGNGAMMVRCVAALPALVGAYAKPGGGFLASISGSAILGTTLTWERFRTKQTRQIPMIKLGPALNETGDKALHGLYIYSSNPAITSPDQNVVRKGLLRDDLFTVVHERFFTDTCKYADIILPATSSLEQDDIYNAYGHYTFGIGYAVIPPVGESKSNWQVMRMLAKAMGVNHPIFDKTARDLIEDILANSSLTEEQKEALRQGQPVEATLPDDYKMQFGTPSGKIELISTRDEDHIPHYFPAHGDKADYYFINPPDARLLDSSFNERDYKEPFMRLYINPLDAQKEGLKNDDTVIAYNERGEVSFPITLSDRVQQGTLVSYGVWWQRYSSDKNTGINALTAARFTDRGLGSTFYDVKVSIRKA